MSENKDFWDKLSALSNLIAGVLIAGMGTFASIQYNNRQLDLQRQNEAAQRKLAELDALERFNKYLTSENQTEREFGYAAFVALGYDSLAVKLIELNDDPAGEKVLQSISRYQIAVAKERKGFQYLLSGQYEKALAAFQEATKAYPTFHSVSEIGQLLAREKDNLTDPGRRKKVFETIVTRYSWKAPADLLAQLRKRVESE